MLKKINRLTKNKEFDSVWKNGRSSFDAILGVKSLANGLTVNRFGILVSLKVSKLAVERNKIKRRLREIIRAELDNIKIGNDITIIALAPANKKDFSGLEASFKNNLKKLRLLN